MILWQDVLKGSLLVKGQPFPVNGHNIFCSSATQKRLNFSDNDVALKCAALSS